MRNLIRFFAITLFTISLSAQTASGQKGYLKSSVREFDEPGRTKMLAFLDECRKVSDAAAKDLANGDISNAIKTSSPNAAKQWSEIVAALKAMKESAPATTLLYRNQALELIGPEETQTSRVWYAVTSPGPTVARNFLSIVVESREGNHAGRVIAIEPISYAEEIPTWLQRVDGPVEPPSTHN